MQVYPELISLLKFLKTDNRYTFIASGSLLGVTLLDIFSIPRGSIEILPMCPLDFEEFLLAMGSNEITIESIYQHYLNNETLDEATHDFIMKHFKYYLLVGGLLDSKNEFIKSRNLVNIRKIQSDTISFYQADCTKYDKSITYQYEKSMI